MFTGLVQGAAKVVAIAPREKDGARLTLAHPLLSSAKPGDSISTNGCGTVTLNSIYIFFWMH
ncbi:MAG: hypothetical protein EBR83_01810 [Verrucomicrobia bacterium]|nr:hypothetical protein [Verrucomicrobiota bacterium]